MYDEMLFHLGYYRGRVHALQGIHEALSAVPVHQDEVVFPLNLK